MSLASAPMRLCRAREGAAAVELALALPVILLMLLPTVDIALAFGAEQRLASAATQAVQRATAVGSYKAEYAGLAADAATAAAGSSKSPIITNAATWLECNGVRAASGVLLCAGGQRYARYVQVTLRSTYTPIFRLPGPLGAARAISGRATVRVQ